MGDLMLRKLFNRRKHTRYVAEQKTYIVYVVPYSGKEKKIQIIDISEGGCGFIYHGDERDLDKVGQVDLMSDNVPYLERVKIAVVNDQPASGEYRRRGVEFKWLGTLDKLNLKSFIQKVTLCKR
jgi:hypothetical protein